jgi:hypothetical protein
MLQALPGFPRSLVACAALVAAGCTMCPDPYDYSGPVPNGSAPQNDFQARSNGILPIGAAPKPFPPVVKATPQPEPATPAVEKPLVAEAEDDVLRLSAETEVPPDASVAEAVVPAADAPPEPAPSADDQVFADAAERDVESPVMEPPAAPDVAETVPDARPQPVTVATEPPLRETPGWRPRR